MFVASILICTLLDSLRRTLFYRHGVLTFGSILVALVAGYWLVQRAFDFQGPF